MDERCTDRRFRTEKNAFRIEAFARYQPSEENVALSEDEPLRSLLPQGSTSARKVMIDVAVEISHRRIVNPVPATKVPLRKIAKYGDRCLACAEQSSGKGED